MFTSKLKVQRLWWCDSSYQHCINLAKIFIFSFLNHFNAAYILTQQCVLLQYLCDISENYLKQHKGTFPLIYIYIYIEREKERERAELDLVKRLVLSLDLLLICLSLGSPASSNLAARYARSWHLQWDRATNTYNTPRATVLNIRRLKNIYCYVF